MSIALGVDGKGFADDTNLIANGSFESCAISPGVPDGWSVSGGSAAWG